LKGVTRGLTETDDSIITDSVPSLRYPPSAQQFAAVRLKHCTASHSWSGRLRIFLRIVHGQPLTLGQPCEGAEASKAMALALAVSSCFCLLSALLILCNECLASTLFRHPVNVQPPPSSVLSGSPSAGRAIIVVGVSPDLTKWICRVFACREALLQRFEGTAKPKPSSCQSDLRGRPAPHLSSASSVAWDIERQCVRSSGRVCISPNHWPRSTSALTLERGASPHSDALELPC
jgi:hypothetical protein